ncbi:MAG: E3 ubiquitin protein ligase [Candidatus Heimdallarchaeota archaeon]|nr:E3 ubiquitin protein ligase [Candidatus Heimdallarchaeota archaeon]
MLEQDYRCNICYKDTSEQDEIRCPSCINIYHHDHLAAWLLTKNYCPVCRAKFEHSFMEIMKPKTEYDYQRLWKINQSLDRIQGNIEKWEKTHSKKFWEDPTDEDEEPIPWGKIFGPLFLFALWMLVLFAIFG